MTAIRLWCCLSVLVLTQCSKCTDLPQPTRPEPRLPPATQTGARTLGCRVNGNVFAPANTLYMNASWGYAGPGAEYFLQINSQATVATEDDFSTMGIVIQGELATNETYPLVAVPTHTGNHGAVRFGHRLRCDYDAPRVVRGRVTLSRFDALARIAAGTFDFVLFRPGCDTLRVTDGRFDVTF